LTNLTVSGDSLIPSLDMKIFKWKCPRCQREFQETIKQELECVKLSHINFHIKADLRGRI
jgi:hypothetical protein